MSLWHQLYLTKNNIKACIKSKLIYKSRSSYSKSCNIHAIRFKGETELNFLGNPLKKLLLWSPALKNIINRSVWISLILQSDFWLRRETLIALKMWPDLVVSFRVIIMTFRKKYALYKIQIRPCYKRCEKEQIIECKTKENTQQIYVVHQQSTGYVHGTQREIILLIWGKSNYRVIKS